MNSYDVPDLRGINAVSLANALGGELGVIAYQPVSEVALIMRSDAEVRVIDTSVGRGFLFDRSRYSTADLEAESLAYALSELSRIGRGVAGLGSVSERAGNA